MLLFLTALQRSTDIELTKENANFAAKLTFGNVVLISALFTIINEVWRCFTVTRPVRHIVKAVSKIMDGDFSTRIQPLIGVDNDTGFNTIIDYFNRMAEELSGIETLRTD